MAHRLLRDAEADGWERSDFPIICESCLGDNPYVRMTKADYDKECKICTRPFTVFRWRPGRDARYKKTEICQTCSKLKNVCQVCLLDLEYGLPVQVRDTALSINSNDAIPKSDVNREYFAEEHDRRARAGIDYESSYGKVRANDTILKLQRTTPYYKRNRAHVCSFYVRGQCTRGPECPYRHEMPVEGELSQQNIKDRYYGVNDPVALKLLNKAGEMPSLEPPDDESIRTLSWWSRRKNHRAGPERQLLRSRRNRVQKAAEELSNKLVIKGLRLKLLWGRPQAQKPESDGSDEANKQQAAVTHSGLLPRAVISQQQGQPLQPPGTQTQPPPMPYFNIPPLMPQQDRAYYPSMDPQRMGAVIPSQDGRQQYGYPGMPPPGQFYPPPPPFYPPPYGYMPPSGPPPPNQQYPQPYQSMMPPPPPPRPSGGDQSSYQQKGPSVTSQHP
ncbi:hypothetical protein DH2020_024117 [Rehmannia glutinosa]|uniref:C3H1-type domain-containing protein n=1 Tax=Rehmannia glutinosa TaxID=99300 RepID=A0ABR0W9N6_REHGL